MIHATVSECCKRLKVCFECRSPIARKEGLGKLTHIFLCVNMLLVYFSDYTTVVNTYLTNLHVVKQPTVSRFPFEEVLNTSKAFKVLKSCRNL
jgi:hypothetical protein